METAVTFQAHALAWLSAIAGVVCLGVALCWALSRKWRLRRLAELRARYAEMQPGDPEYNQVRALYIDMTVATYGSTVGSALLYETAGDGASSPASASGDTSSGGDGGGGSSGGD